MKNFLMRISKKTLAGYPPETLADALAIKQREDDEYVWVDRNDYEKFMRKPRKKIGVIVAPAVAAPAPQPATKIGLGDMVAAVTQPIAKVIDAVAGTDLQNCRKCEQRKQALNAL